MVLPGIFFTIARVTELTFLIPIIGMLSYFVHGYVQANYLTPNFVLVLFIVSVIAGVWALSTLLFYGSTKHNGHLIAFVDICIFGALIAGVYELGQIGMADCSNFSDTNPIYLQLGVFAYEPSKSCNLLKASFALAIMEILFFFWSALIGLWIHHHHRNDPENRRRSSNYRREEKRYSSSRQNRRSSSRGAGPRSRSRGPAPRSRSVGAIDNQSDQFSEDYDSRPRRGGGSTVARSRSQQRGFV